MSDREEKRDREASPRHRESTEGSSRLSRTKKAKAKGKKRRLPKGSSTRSRKRSTLGHPAKRSQKRGIAPEPPPRSQPSIEGFDEEIEGMGRPEQEPPPPTAFLDPGPGGEGDDLFEYVI